jgi:hypothetical protein
MQVGEGRAKLTVSVRPRTYDALRELPNAWESRMAA